MLVIACYDHALGGRRVMDEPKAVAGDRAYFAQRAAEELELALSAADEDAAAVHRRLQRVYTERASVGGRVSGLPEKIG
jgi:hypothetical protein